MLEADKVFAGSVPENYDRHFVPLIFQQYADDIARRAVALSPGAVLETAAGTGVVTRTLAPKLPTGATYIATDLNQPMLDHAASRQPAGSNVDWRQADALALPFDDASFDLVLCQFGAMFFPDRVAGYREAKRVLRPGGHFLFNVWDRIEENVFADDVTNALAAFFPDDPPRMMVRTPHGYYDTALITRDLEEAGFSSVAIDTIAKESRGPSARIVALAYCQGTPVSAEISARGDLDAATDYVTSALTEKYGGEMVGKIQAHVIKARPEAWVVGRYGTTAAAIEAAILATQCGASHLWQPNTLWLNTFASRLDLRQHVA